MNGDFTLQNYTLWPLFIEITRIASSFSHHKFFHVYKKQNQDADKLSKDGVEMDQGSWKIFEKLWILPMNIFTRLGTKSE
jgi:hypothetical protein